MGPRRIVEHFSEDRANSSSIDQAGLTVREREVLTLLARGASNEDIAGELFVTPATVKTHVGHVLGKLGARSRTHAVVLAYEAGMVPRRR